jgi:histidine triad (HIT) family protein
MQAHGPVSCFVCGKHADPSLMPGGPVGADDLVVVSHLSPQSPGRDGQPVYLGYLFVEPRRHAAGLADLTEPEAQAVGLWCARASRALRDAAGADHVYAAVLGNRAPHLHVHLVARYPGTPREYQGLNADDWPGAERGTASQVADFVARLRTYLGR